MRLTAYFASAPICGRSFEDSAGLRLPVVTYKTPWPAPEGRPGRRYFELVREAARQRGRPIEYVAFLDGVETRD